LPHSNQESKMHYITGTSFTVSPSFKVLKGVRDKQFQPGIKYTLLTINKKEDNYIYKFRGSDNSFIEVAFVSCNDADAFISKYRNEKLPQYNYNSSEEYFKLD